jgi:hypothetical protein
MSIFDKKANRIISSLLSEGVDSGEMNIKVSTPTGNVDIRVKCVETQSGTSYIADESVDSIHKGDDVTEMVVSDEDEEFNFKKADLNKDGKLSSYEKARGEAVAGAKEEDEEVEDPELKKLGLGKDAIAAVTVAGKLATKAGGLGMASITQNRMNAAYGDLMRKIAKKVTQISNKIK